LFRSVIANGIVPDDFGLGIIIPLVKDKPGDFNNIDDYRGVYLISNYFKVTRKRIVNLL